MNMSIKTNEFRIYEREKTMISHDIQYQSVKTEIFSYKKANQFQI